MAYSFGAKPWFEQVADTSTRPEYQTAVIRIEDPSLVTSDYDIETGEYTDVGDPVIYPQTGEDGRARVIGVRWGVHTGGESQANSTSISAIRVQIPRGAVSRVKRGCKVYVESAPNPVLQGYVFTVTSDMQGSSDAARTFECALDIDSIRAVDLGTLTVTGTSQEGQTLEVGSAGVSPEGTELTYQWFAVTPPVPPATEPTTSPIPGATSAEFEIPAGYSGYTLYALVTGKAAAFSPTTKKTPEVLVG